MVETAATCPECGAPMVLRTARRGRNAGNQFYGCSAYPSCRGTRPLDDVSGDEGSVQSQKGRAEILGLQPRVMWADWAEGREWSTLYTIGGGRLRSSDQIEKFVDTASPVAKSRLQQTFVAVGGMDRPIRDPALDQVVGTFRKLLQRGDHPPLDPTAERNLARAIESTPIPSDIPGDLNFELPDVNSVTETAVHTSLFGSRDNHVPRTDWMLDSQEEDQFLEILARQCGPEVARWVYPQPSLGALTNDPSDARRADFLISLPWRPPLVVEIDGLQHRAATQEDDDRDALLRERDIEVVRIEASEIRAGRIGSLPELLAAPPMDSIPRDIDRLVHGPAQATRLGIALAEAVSNGALEGAGNWVLRIYDSLGIVPAFMPSLLELFASVDELWAGYLAPQSVRVEADDGVVGYRRVGIASYEVAEVDSISDPVTIYLDHDLGPADALPKIEGPTIVVRGATLPVRLAERRAEGAQLALAKDPRAMGEALQRVLQFVFAKKDFREGQLEALSQVLQRRDCLVLLPTGAGKSLVYQMAGLLLPGRTIIIDPIVALMEDQVGGLRRAGVDRAVGLSSFVTRQGLSDQAMAMVQSGDALFCFIAPERLQQGSFREALQALTVSVPVNLAVVDEAHCISEWGHDFRPAYLNLGPLLRRLCRAPDRSTPPILALTGTASRAVLRDVLIELDLDRSDPSGVIKPESFGRPELSFEVIQASPGGASARLVGLLNALPSRLGIPNLYQPSRRKHLGIVFCPHVDGELGVVSVSRMIQSKVTPHVGYYAGKAPQGHDRNAWDFSKRRTANGFRNGETTVLCATNAFGMGVDIPNVRFTVHFGIPGSLEAFYQEAGRAGRDRQPSHCAAVFTELDPRLSELLLSDSSDGDTVRDLFEQRARGDSDDILNQLWFHFNSFQGLSVEQDALEALVQQLAWNGTGKSESIPFARSEDQRSSQERAILRLHQVGMVADYLKDWGGRSYTVRLAEAQAGDLDDAFLRFVVRTQPGRVEERRAALAELPNTITLAERASKLALMAMEMVYDSVEKSRRRALREMRLLAAEARDSREIQQRIEDYFREGELAPVLEGLVESTSLDLGSWFGIYRSQSKADEGELRGSTARLLESYPDHPGLLVGRALAELMSGASEFEFRDNVARAYSFGRDRYSLSASQADGLVRFMLEQVGVYEPSWRPLVWLAFEEGFGGKEEIPTEGAALRSPDTTPGETVILLERRLSRLSDLATTLVEHGRIRR